MQQASVGIKSSLSTAREFLQFYARLQEDRENTTLGDRTGMTSGSKCGACILLQQLTRIRDVMDEYHHLQFYKANLTSSTCPRVKKIATI